MKVFAEPFAGKDLQNDFVSHRNTLEANH